MAFVNSLEESFGTHVDVVTDTSEDTGFIEQIRKEAILLYEQPWWNHFEKDYFLKANLEKLFFDGE